MRLREPKELDIIKSKDRKLEIDEGMNLARRVDTLRVTLADEEKKLSDFRTQATSAVMGEIQLLQSSKESLRSEIQSLEAHRDELKKPLDAEWNTMRERAAYLDDREQQLAQTEQILASRQSEGDALMEHLTTRDVATVAVQKSAYEVEKSAHVLLNTRAAELAEFRKEKLEWQQQHDRIMRSIESKEQQLANDIQHNKVFKEQLTKEARALTLKKRLYGTHN